MSQPARPTRVKRNAVLASGVARRRSEAMATMAPAPTQMPSTAAIDRLAAAEHRLDEVAGHAGEGEQALHVAADQRADDVVHVAAGAEVAAVRAEDDRRPRRRRRPARGTSRAARRSFRRSAGSCAPAGRARRARCGPRSGSGSASAGRARRVIPRLPSDQPVADRLQPGDELVRLADGDRAEQLVHPGLVRGGERGELRPRRWRSAARASRGGRPRPAPAPPARRRPAGRRCR